MKQSHAVAGVLTLSFIILAAGFYFYQHGGEVGIPHFTEPYLNPPANRTLPTPEEPLPQPITSLRIPYSFKVSWAPLWDGFYVSMGGVYLLKVNNTSEDSLYVKSITMRAGGKEGSVEVMREVSGEEVVGILHLPGPPKDGDYTLQVVLDIYAGREGKWHHYPSVSTQSSTVKALPLPEVAKYRIHADRELYDLVNGKIWGEIGEIRNETVRILGNLTGEFGLDQIIHLYRWVEENIDYISDPGGLANYWASPMETLRLGAGDCEDVALLLGSMITSIGGNVRIAVAERHAYLMLYAGWNPAGLALSIGESYRTTLPVAFYQDSYGYWLVVDPLSHSYPGSLPIGVSPSLDGGLHLFPGTFHGGYVEDEEVLYADIFRGGNI
ncbi:MAG: transglutaminase domain-containing protein [Thermoplasmata archaeon]|nr:transglutaminase domain-containing protein [Thermoplasmata archaeon]